MPIWTQEVEDLLSKVETTKKICKMGVLNEKRHPTNVNKYLILVCLEGPEAGVYYRGKSEIINNKYVEIELPDYVEKLAFDFTVQITPIYSGKIVTLNSGEVENNKFRVYGENSRFHWIVYGKRFDIEVEPNKLDVNVKGDGPYLYL